MREHMEKTYGNDLQTMWSSYCDSMQEICSETSDICTKDCEKVQVRFVLFLLCIILIYASVLHFYFMVN